MKKLLITILAMVSFANISYAAGKHSTEITIYENVYVGGHTLTPGEYSVKWVDGSNELSIVGHHANYGGARRCRPACSLYHFRRE